MTQRKKEDEKWVAARLTIELFRVLLQLAVLVLPIIHGLLYFAPSDLNKVVGAETHTEDENLIAYYCQDPETGDFSSCTSDDWELVATGLPPVVGVASDGSGNLIILFEEEGYYWTGDTTNGPTQQIMPTQEGLVVIDIAANQEGAFVAACRQGARVIENSQR